MNLTQKQVIELWREEEIEVNDVTLELVEEGDFEQDYKYQSAQIIFTDGTKHYSAFITRSGSPFTDWEYQDYGDADITEVEKREVTVTKWVAV